jgi:UDP:flavonoid glycosyltransferase YjiC (YdhE family)
MGKPRETPFDVAYIGNFRKSGAAASLIADEIALHAKAGYSTVLLPFEGPDAGDGEAVHPALDALVRTGQASLAGSADAALEAKLALVHEPAALSRNGPMGRLAAPPLQAGRALVVANEPPADHSGAARFDIARIDAAVRDLTGCEAAWAPAWPNVRAQLASKSQAIDVSQFYWSPVVDAGRWGFEREAPARLSPTIGRHGRPEPEDWPEDLKVFLSRYPLSRHVAVSLLGVYQPLLNELGRTPRNWSLFPFGSIVPERFLRSLDYFVYHPGWRRRAEVDRGILEGLASGAIALLPRELEAIFGEAALYPEDGRDALETMVALFRDRQAFLAQVRRGQAFVRDGHGPHVHIDRIEALVGPPSHGPVPGPADRSKSGHSERRGPGQRSRPLLFVSSNGVGLGHLSRLLAIANRMNGNFQPIFATMSQGLAVVRDAGYHAEYLPHHFYAECDRGVWNDWLRLEISRLIELFGIGALIYDGGSPYRGVSEAVANTSNVKSVWCRRAMWRDALWDQAIDQTKFVDLVIEPGELAAARDIGATVAHRGQAQHVEPVLLLDEADLLSREDARLRLGLDPDRPAVLLQLGSGNHVSLVPAIDRMIAAIEAGGEIQPVIAEWMIADRSLDHWPQVRRLTGFPNAAYFRAFDFVVSSAGYNSFHELLHFAVPTVFVPIEVSYLDNQAARAAFAADEGLALSLGLSDMELFPEVLEQMMDPETRSRLAETCRRHRRPNGAAEAAALIAELAA